MSIVVRPARGGFLRPFGCGWFIREFLLGHGPQGSPTIDPQVGTCQADIFYYYKIALQKAYAEDAVDRENEQRIRDGKPIYNPEEYAERVKLYQKRIPYKTYKARYHSFQRYFHWLKQLGWVEFTGQEELSSLQEHYSPSPPRRYFRLSDVGRTASETAWSNPHRALYEIEPVNQTRSQ